MYDKAEMCLKAKQTVSVSVWYTGGFSILTRDFINLCIIIIIIILL